MTKSSSHHVLIVGGGMAGLTLAVALGRAGLDVALVDAVDLDDTVAPEFDGRVTAIAYSSWQMLQAIGAWDAMAGHAEPILDIRVTDGSAPVFLNFDHQALGRDPFGQMVENRHIRGGLIQTLQDLPTVKIVAPARVESVEREGGVAAALLQDGQTVHAALIVGADGRSSRIRQSAGIKTVGHRYDQTGIVTTVEHEKPHHGIAHERFLTPGPFAILPLQGTRSSLVWSEAPDVAVAILKLEDAAFDQEIARRFGGFMGAVHAVGPRFGYPYAVHVAERFTDTRLALVGDAAHGIHPIAGQGLNLGWRDVAALAELVTDSARLGLDVGSTIVLERYDRWRRVDTLTLATVTDSLNALFTNDIAPLRLARDVGLAAVERLGPVKQFFMEHARGTVGTLPRLLKGESL
ncbi:MAG: UbiH/UbiF/VisC/COQ6 family ubiquinone biosynthesis hydroxylase [Alphaproteobacteria bacterium]